MSDNNKKSPIWNFFSVVDAYNAKCTVCRQILSYKSSISNLKKHFNRKHPTISFPVLGTQKTNHVPGENTEESDDFSNADVMQVQSTSVFSLSTSTNSSVVENPAKKRKQETLTAFLPKK